MTKIKTPQLRADPTRAKILKAARKLFSVSGFAGTSIGKIAENYAGFTIYFIKKRPRKDITINYW